MEKLILKIVSFVFAKVVILRATRLSGEVLMEEIKKRSLFAFSKEDIEVLKNARSIESLPIKFLYEYDTKYTNQYGNVRKGKMWKVFDIGANALHLLTINPKGMIKSLDSLGEDGTGRWEIKDELECTWYSTKCMSRVSLENFNNTILEEYYVIRENDVMKLIKPFALYKRHWSIPKLINLGIGKLRHKILYSYNESYRKDYDETLDF